MADIILVAQGTTEATLTLTGLSKTLTFAVTAEVKAIAELEGTVSIEIQNEKAEVLSATNKAYQIPGDGHEIVAITSSLIQVKPGKQLTIKGVTSTMASRVTTVTMRAVETS